MKSKPAPFLTFCWYFKSQPRVILLCEDCSLYVLDEDIKDNLTEVFDKSAGLNLKKKEVDMASRRETFQKTNIEKLITR